MRPTRRIATLDRFIFRSSKRCHKIVIALRKKKKPLTRPRMPIVTIGLEKVSIRPVVIVKTSIGRAIVGVFSHV